MCHSPRQCAILAAILVCSTITSDQIIGGGTFALENDKRPHVVMMIGEQEYHTNESLPKFAAEQLGKDYKISFVFADETDRNRFPGLEVVKDADVLLVSVRRRTLPPDQLDYVRKHVAAGKPVIGIRTASHAFTLRREEPPEGLAAWPEFDAQVLGGRYTGHHGNNLKSTISIVPEQAAHPILRGVTDEPFIAGGSLYKTSPVNERATVLLTGEIESAMPEPVAWTFKRDDGGHTFYTSLGHAKDLENPAFITLLKNAIDWTARPGLAAGPTPATKD